MKRLKHYLDHTPPEKISTSAAAFLANLDEVEKVSPKIANSILKELIDQRSHLKLIASENYSSRAVQAAMGNHMTDKYAEGYVHHRFYAGCENVDDVEEEAVNQLKTIYGCDHAYVQPHSGADANLIAFWSILVHRVENREIEKLNKKSVDELTDEEYERVRQLMLNQKMLGMSLNSGGHLTHGYRRNISSKMMQATSYDVDRKTGLIDYDQIAKQAREEKPDILLAGYSAYPRNINFAKMKEIAEDAGAVFMVDMAHFSGLVAGKVMTGEFDPVPYADIITSTTHKTLRGPRGGMVLCTKEYAEIVDKGCPLVLGGPLPHVIAAKGVAFKEANTAEFQKYAGDVVANAQALAEGIMEQGGDVLTGGTDNHIVLIDVSPFGVTGRQAELALTECGITVNRNAIPFDKNGPWYTSGIRVGTAAAATLGMGPAEMKTIADLLVRIFRNIRPAKNEKTGGPSKAKYEFDQNIKEECRQTLNSLLKQFPLYPEIEIEEELALTQE